MWCIFKSERTEHEATLHTAVQKLYSQGWAQNCEHHTENHLSLFSSVFVFFQRLTSAAEWKLQEMKCYLFVLFTGTSLILFLCCVFTDLYICIYFLLLPLKWYQVQLRSTVLGERPQALTLFSFVLRIFLKTSNSFLIILWLKLIPSL